MEYVDDTRYEQYLPVSDQYENKLPAVLDQLEQLQDNNIAEDGQPYSIDFEFNEHIGRTYRMGRMLAKRTIESGRIMTDRQELLVAYYQGLMFSRQAISMVQRNKSIDKVHIRSVTCTDIGAEGSIQEYESSRPNISQYVRTNAELMEDQPGMTLAIGDAAVLGFLLYERADGKQQLMHDIDSAFTRD